MAKVFPAPGVSSRPLNLLERFDEWYLDKVYSRRGRRSMKLSPLWHWKQRQQRRQLQALVGALSVGTVLGPGKSLRVESLETTLKVVTFDDKAPRFS